MNEFEVATQLMKEWNVPSWIGTIVTLVLVMVLIKKYLLNGVGTKVYTLAEKIVTLEKERVSTQIKTEVDLRSLVEGIKKMSTLVYESRDHSGDRINLVEQRILQRVHELDEKVCDTHKTTIELFHIIEKRENLPARDMGSREKKVS